MAVLNRIREVFGFQLLEGWYGHRVSVKCGGKANLCGAYLTLRKVVPTA